MKRRLIIFTILLSSGLSIAMFQNCGSAYTVSQSLDGKSELPSSGTTEEPPLEGAPLNDPMLPPTEGSVPVSDSLPVQPETDPAVQPGPAPVNPVVQPTATPGSSAPVQGPAVSVKNSQTLVRDEMVVEFSTATASAQQIIISWSAVSQTAMAGVHFEAADGVVTLAPGQTSAFLRLPVLKQEATATQFEVVVNSVIGAAVSQARAVVQIPAFQAVVTLQAPPAPELFKEITGGGHSETCGINASNELICWGSIHHQGIGLQKGIFPYGIEFVPMPAMRRVMRFAKQVSAGEFHTCAINQEDKVFCWGGNFSYQLGAALGKGVHSKSPVEITGLSGVRQVSAGPVQTCALNSAGEVYCWGGETTLGAIRRVGTLAGVQQIDVGLGSHACALTAGSKVVCWGSNTLGQLGNNTTTNSEVPVEVVGLSGAKAVSVGIQHTCAHTAVNGVSCWGVNRGGQLGRGTISERGLTAAAVANLSDVKSLKVLGDQSCAMTNSGKTLCWGENSQDQLKINSMTDVSTPLEIAPLNGAKKLAQNCFISANDQVLCRGANDFAGWGLNGQNSTVQPLAMPTSQSYKQMSISKRHICAVDSQDFVNCWGSNFYGQLGIGTTASSDVPARVTQLSGIKMVAVSPFASCALSHQGIVQCWGNNSSGNLGNGTTTNSSIPVAVRNLAGVTQITHGGSHACALTSAGQVYCWGGNNLYQLGNGTTTSSRLPVQVSALSGIKQIAGGIHHTCALNDQGKVFCWGAMVDMAYSPSIQWGATVKSVDFAQPIQTLSSGEGHVCALDQQKKVYCFGNNDWEQLGKDRREGYSSNAATPALVPGLSDVAEISLGAQHSCARTSFGAVLCWGKNTYGQLATLRVATSDLPRQIFGVGAVDRIMATGAAIYFFKNSETAQSFVGTQKFESNRRLTPVVKISE